MLWLEQGHHEGQPSRSQVVSSRVVRRQRTRTKHVGLLDCDELEYVQAIQRIGANVEKLTNTVHDESVGRGGKARDAPNTPRRWHLRKVVPEKSEKNLLH